MASLILRQFLASLILLLVLQKKDMYPFPSMLNYRMLVGKKDGLSQSELKTNFTLMTNVERGDGGKLTFRVTPNFGKVYRSSRPDFLTEEEISQFMTIQINGIIDFRSAYEYKTSHFKLIDQYYSLYKVKIPLFREYKYKESVKCVRIKSSEIQGENDFERKHYLIDFYGFRYAWNAISELPKLLRFLSVFYLFYDSMAMKKFGFLARKKSLCQIYKEILHRSRLSICAALKLLCDPKNIPALINCAYGKDRTGIMSAIVLSCLGYSKEYICEDYAQSITMDSHKKFSAFPSRWPCLDVMKIHATKDDTDDSGQIQLEPYFSKWEKERVSDMEEREDIIKANRKVMKLLLEYIENKFGGMPGYLEFIGFFPEDQELLIKNLSD